MSNVNIVESIFTISIDSHNEISVEVKTYDDLKAILKSCKNEKTATKNIVRYCNNFKDFVIEICNDIHNETENK
jgi:hypothetical protein